MSPVDKSVSPWLFSDDFSADHLAEYTGTGGVVSGGLLTGACDRVFPTYRLSGQGPDSVYDHSRLQVKFRHTQNAATSYLTCAREVRIRTPTDSIITSLYMSNNGFPGSPSYPYLLFSIQLNTPRSDPEGQSSTSGNIYSPYGIFLNEDLYITATLSSDNGSDRGNHFRAQLWIASQGYPLGGATAYATLELRTGYVAPRTVPWVPGQLFTLEANTGQFPTPEPALQYARISSAGGVSFDEWSAEVEEIVPHVGPGPAKVKRHARRVLGGH